MTELKTLKDLTINLSKNLGTKKPDKDFQIAKILELKQEAIKWIKMYDREELRFGRWEFMKFHNITEEDLK